MYQDNKKQLIWCQMFHCVLFLFMGSFFSAMYSKTANDSSCEADNDRGCYFKKQDYPKEPLSDYSVQDKFQTIFAFGIFTYFADAVFRFIVVLGLLYNKLWIQIFGIILTVIVSTFL